MFRHIFRTEYSNFVFSSFNSNFFFRPVNNTLILGAKNYSRLWNYSQAFDGIRTAFLSVIIVVFMLLRFNWNEHK